MAEVCARAAEKHGPLAVTPAKVLALTPLELLTLFARPPGVDGGQLDSVADLHRVNHEVRASAPPIVPSWIMPKVPRRGR